LNSRTTSCCSPVIYADACKHCPSDEIGDEQERLDRNLPFSAILVGLLELENKGAPTATSASGKSWRRWRRDPAGT
jgi:hypothetical protein